MAGARKHLSDDEWAELIVRLPFGPSQARRLVRIGNCGWLRPHVGALPSDIETLDRLSALSDERAEELVADDTIHPGMDRGALEPDSEVHEFVEGLARRRNMMRIMASLMKARAVAARAS